MFIICVIVYNLYYCYYAKTSSPAVQICHSKVYGNLLPLPWSQRLNSKFSYSHRGLTVHLPIHTVIEAKHYIHLPVHSHRGLTVHLPVHTVIEAKQYIHLPVHSHRGLTVHLPVHTVIEAKQYIHLPVHSHRGLTVHLPVHTVIEAKQYIHLPVHSHRGITVQYSTPVQTVLNFNSN